MGSTFQPPIHIDPTQDPSAQVSFINQNFQTIASTLETNSFRIVSSGEAGISSNGATVTWNSVPHNLGFAPIPFAFLTGVTVTAGASVISSDANIPIPTYTNATFDTVKASAMNSGNALPIVAFNTYIEVFCDTTNLYIVLYNATGSTVANHNIQYYLVQQPAG